MNEELRQFSVAFEVAPGAALIVDMRGCIVLTNRALNSLLEYDDGELLGQPIETLVPQAPCADHLELRNAYLHLPTNREMAKGREVHASTKSGRLVPVEIKLSRVTLEGESFIAASLVDITERKKEQEITRLALDAAASAMIMADPGGRIVLINRSAVEVFGYTAEELIGQNVELLLPPELRRRHNVYRTSYSTEPERRNMGSGRDLFARRKDGKEFPVEIGLTPIKGHNQQFIMATIIDITERKAAEKAMRSKNDDLTRLNHELAQFAYSASHDLKAPLSTIEGLLNCIEEDVADGNLDGVAHNTAQAKLLSVKLKTLIESILGLARAESLEEKAQRLALTELVDDALLHLRIPLEQRNVRVTADVPDDHTLHCEPTRIKQILENLIGNAAKYSDPSKPERYVRIASSRHNGTLDILVEDNGIGIPENAHANVFKMFKRFANHREPGSGLGLALVKQHVERLGGQISFKSSPSGSQFLVSLPTQPQD